MINGRRGGQNAKMKCTREGARALSSADCRHFWRRKAAFCNSIWWPPSLRIWAKYRILGGELIRMKIHYKCSVDKSKNGRPKPPAYAPRVRITRLVLANRHLFG